MVTILGACSKNDSSAGQQNSTGMAGSLARFAIVDDRLFTVSDQAITVYNISNTNTPVKQVSTSLGFGVETIFPRGNTLFIGTQTGMKILDVSNRNLPPVVLSDFTHVRSCDPVVANSTHAYVTLRTGNTCTRGINELQVLNITNLNNPQVVKLYTMKNPKGLALDGNNLFVCDEGIKYYDATNPSNLALKRMVDAQAEDLIAHEGILMAIGPDGLTQYSYQSGDLVFLSKIPTL
jgi:hypothetical protein